MMRDRGQELRTGSGTCIRVRLLSPVQTPDCNHAIHTRHLGQRWCPRWLPEFRIKADFSGKILPKHMSLPMECGWALYFARSCTSHKLACMPCLEATQELSRSGRHNNIGLFSNTVTEVEELLEHVKDTFDKDGFKLHELDVYPEGGPLLGWSSTQRPSRHETLRRCTHW